MLSQRSTLTREREPRLPELLNVASPPKLVSPLYLNLQLVYTMVTIMKEESNKLSYIHVI
jgi:hypothetical protein